MPLSSGARLGPYEISPRSARAAWARCTVRGTRASGARSRSRSCRRRSRTTRPARAIRAARRGRSPRSTTPTSSPSTTSAIERRRAYIVTELLEGETLRARARPRALPVAQGGRERRPDRGGSGRRPREGHRPPRPQAGEPVRHQRRAASRSSTSASRSCGARSADVARARETALDAHRGRAWCSAPSATCRRSRCRGRPADHRSRHLLARRGPLRDARGAARLRRATAAETMTAILREDPPEASVAGRPVAPALERTVRRCLEKNPAERFQSRGRGVRPRGGFGRVGDGCRGRASQTGRRRFLAWGSLALPAAAAGVLGYVAGQHRERSGTVPRLSFKRLTFRRGPIVTARFGRTVARSSEPLEAQPFRVYQTRPEGGEFPLPVENAELLAVARDGRVAVLLVKRSATNAWWKKGTLAVVAAAGGAPRELAEDVRGRRLLPRRASSRRGARRLGPIAARVPVGARPV